MSEPPGSPIIFLYFLQGSTQKWPLTFENCNVVFPLQSGQLRVAGKNEILCQESCNCVCVSVWARGERGRERERIWWLQTSLRKWNWNRRCFISFVIWVVSKTCIYAVCNEQYANPESFWSYSFWLEWKLLLSSNKLGRFLPTWLL